MYKVLIVDDERIVRLALNSIIDWEKQDFAVCGSAASGPAALELIQSQSPQLVITDIVMPGMDGLELIEQARAAGYTGEFILLTNHQDFSYAVKALKAGAFDYVLKTDLTPDSFLAVLERVRARLDASAPVSAAGPDSDDPDLARAAGWITHPVQDPIPLSAPHFLMEVFVRSDITGIPYHGPASTLKSIVDDLLKLPAPRAVSLSNTCVAAIFPARQAQALLREWESRLPRLCERVRLYMNTECAFVLSREFEDAHGLRARLERCARLRPSVIYRGFGSLIQEEEEAAFCADSLSVNETFATVQGCLDRREYRQAYSLCQHFWEDCRTRNVLPSLVTNASTTLQNLLLIHNSLWIERALQAEEEAAAPKAFPCTMTEHLRYFSDLIELIRSSKERFSLADCREEIARLDQYIHEHISEHITLSVLSRQVNMTENYLSRMFKAETGLNIVTYINLVKLEQARMMLSQPGTSIKSVALELGFEEPSYFNKIFNKTYGLNPSDYKKLLFHEMDAQQG